jgi:CMP-N,N'-diacetyllegionaminic acid synthase
MNNLAIIPARSGSKGLIGKNIKLLNNKPLLAYSIDAALNSGMFDEVMVSTDSEEYAEIARYCGAKVPFMRSKDLASDITSSWDVVKDVIGKYKMLGRDFDTVALLQPTSPLRTSDDIIAGYDVMDDKNANLVVSVCEMDHSPLWANTLPEDFSMNNFIKSEVSKLPRQNIPTYYRINGALYIIKVEYLLNTPDIYAERSFATVMNKAKSVDIDSLEDFVIAEYLILKQINQCNN